MLEESFAHAVDQIKPSLSVEATRTDLRLPQTMSRKDSLKNTLTLGNVKDSREGLNARWMGLAKGSSSFLGVKPEKSYQLCNLLETSEAA